MDPIRNKLFLSDLIKMDFPQSVYEEVMNLLSRVYLDYDFTRLSGVFKDVVSLCNGNYPGFRQCTTPYHDLKHMTDALLALASLVHGAYTSGVTFRERHVTLALISMMFHDTGYIQREGDTAGTGAKYALVRVERSIEFLDEYFAEKGYDENDRALCASFIKCTETNATIEESAFACHGDATLARMVATADIIGQIADRTYLEKLLFLFQELSEVHVLEFRTELDLLENTFESYRLALFRMEHELDNVKRYLKNHFLHRWEIESDMYDDAIESNISYLTYLLENHRNDYRKKLNRGGLLKRLAVLEEAES